MSKPFQVTRLNHQADWFKTKQLPQFGIFLVSFNENPHIHLITFISAQEQTSAKCHNGITSTECTQHT